MLFLLKKNIHWRGSPHTTQKSRLSQSTAGNTQEHLTTVAAGVADAVKVVEVLFLMENECVSINKVKTTCIGILIPFIMLPYTLPISHLLYNDRDMI